MNSFVVAVFCTVLVVANAGLIANPGLISSGIVAPIGIRSGLIGSTLVAPAIAAPANTIIAGPSGAVITNRGLGLASAVGPISTTGLIGGGLIGTPVIARTGLIGGGLIGSPVIARSGLIDGGIIGSPVIAGKVW